MQTLDAPHPNPAGCPAWARSRQPRYWAWNAAGLVGNDPRHRRPCRRPKGSRRPPWRRSCGLRDAGRDGVRDAAAGGLRDVQSDSRDVRLERDRAGRFEEPGMYSVGLGMVLAIGDLAGATFVTLLAATATQCARAGRPWTLCTIEIALPCRFACPSCTAPS